MKTKEIILSVYGFTLLKIKRHSPDLYFSLLFAIHNPKAAEDKLLAIKKYLLRVEHHKLFTEIGADLYNPSPEPMNLMHSLKRLSELSAPEEKEDVDPQLKTRNLLCQMK
jgi:hypothetical protein